MAAKEGPFAELARRAQLKGIPGNAKKAALVVAAVLVFVALARWLPAQGDGAFEIVTSDSAGQSAQSAQSAQSSQGGEAVEGGKAVAGDGIIDAEQAAGEGSGDGAGDQGATQVVVHIAGAVKAPGVYELSEGDRIVDAVEAAGGLADSADASAVNLARVLVDGEQVYIPQAGEDAQGTAGSSGSSGTAGTSSASGTSGGAQAGLVNINTASSEELQELPGIGPSTAESIIAYRSDVGSFATKEDIQKVSGIGEGKYAKIEALICV